MNATEVKQICWTYLIENGVPTDGTWSYYGGDWDHLERSKQWDTEARNSDRSQLVLKVKELGVNWELTDFPTFDVRSEFCGTFSPSSDTNTMIGTLVMSNGDSYKLGCKDQPDYLEDWVDKIKRQESFVTLSNMFKE